MSNWISVKDRLPEQINEPLLIVSDGCVYCATFHPNYCGEINRWHQINYDRNGYENVTHWQPLPEPPQIVTE